MTFALDHLLWGVSDLDEGVAHLAQLVGVEPEPGGEHPGFGTRNALLSLGAGVYLEVIAPDPLQDLGGTRGESLAALAVPTLLTFALRASDLPRLALQVEAAGLLTPGAGRDVAAAAGPAPPRLGGSEARRPPLRRFAPLLHRLGWRANTRRWTRRGGVPLRDSRSGTRSTTPSPTSTPSSRSTWWWSRHRSRSYVRRWRPRWGPLRWISGRCSCRVCEILSPGWPGSTIAYSRLAWRSVHAKRQSGKPEHPRRG